MSAPLAFGLVAPTSGGLADRIERLVRWMGEQVGASIVPRPAGSYEDLAVGARAGTLDVAWLPPIVFVRLGDAMTALGSLVRDGKTTYEAALVVPEGSRIKSIDALRGTRAGWVDRWSASGFVLPRVRLALLGVDPRTCFRTETFHGSHRKTIEALLEGRCDVAGTYARADGTGRVATGAWSEIKGAEVRVIATFDAIPPDVIAVRRGVSDEVQEALSRAFHAACADDRMRPIVREIFGGDEFAEGLAVGYESLESALTIATARGLFD